MTKSVRAAKRLSGQQFMNELEAGTVAARTKLPLSILGEKVVEQGGKVSYYGRDPFISHRFAAELTQITRNRVSEMSQAFNANLEPYTEKIVRDAFTDANFAENLRKGISKNIRDEANRHHVKLTEGVAKRMMRRYDKTFTKNLGSMVMDHIDITTLRTMNMLHKQEMQQTLGARGPEAQRVIESEGFAGLAKKVRGWQVVSDISEEIVEKLARQGTMQGLKETYRLSPAKFPVRPVLLAGMLAYVAGSINAWGQLSTKIKRSVDGMMTDKQSVDDGTHSSPYAITRRLALSDFGSEVRGMGAKKSMTDAAESTMGSIWKRLKNFFVQANAEADAGFASFADTTQAMKMAGVSQRIAAFLQRPAGMMFAGAAIGGFVLAGILTNVKTSREIGEEQAERKRKFKRIRQSYWNTGYDSMNREPESKLRQGYFLHNPMRMSISMLPMAARVLERVGPVLDDIAKWALNFGREAYYRSSVLRGVEETVRRSPETIRRIGQRISEESAFQYTQSAVRYAAKQASAVKGSMRDVESYVKKTDTYDIMKGQLRRTTERIDTAVASRKQSLSTKHKRARAMASSVKDSYKSIKRSVMANTTEVEREIAMQIPLNSDLPQHVLDKRARREYMATDSAIPVITRDNRKYRVESGFIEQGSLPPADVTIDRRGRYTREGKQGEAAVSPGRRRRAAEYEFQSGYQDREVPKLDEHQIATAYGAQPGTVLPLPVVSRDQAAAGNLAVSARSLPTETVRGTFRPSIGNRMQAMYDNSQIARAVMDPRIAKRRTGYGDRLYDPTNIQRIL